MINELELESWAKKFGFTATFGFIGTLLIAGKVLHQVLQKRGLIFGYFIIPPAIISGILGLTLCAIFSNSCMTTDLLEGLEYTKSNLTNFVFAALILGLQCSRTTSHHVTLRAIITSVLHEGMPMVIYYQILVWGQSVVCLAALELLLRFGVNIPILFAGIVPLGLEQGHDIVSANYYDSWSETILGESESLGLLAACLLSCILVSVKPHLVYYGIVSGSSNTKESMSFYQQRTGDAEAFERFSRPSLSRFNHPNSFSNIESSIKPSVSSGDVKTLGKSSTANLSGINNSYHGDKSDFDKLGSASLGAHLSMISLCVFAAFMIAFTFRYIEMQFHIEQHLFSGIRMFKLAMVSAMFSMHYMLSRTSIRFRREWFMRLCGLMLDFLVISALSLSNPKPQGFETTHYLLISFFVTICIIWNVFCFIFVARRLFPNYWYERGLIINSDALGHSLSGLLTARTLDPAMESPILSAYAYKLMIFFIPSTGAKNVIVLKLVYKYGALTTLLICGMIVGIWWIVFEAYFKTRFVTSSSMNNAQNNINISRANSDSNLASSSNDFSDALSFDHIDDSKSSNHMVSIATTNNTFDNFTSGDFSNTTSATRRSSTLKPPTHNNISILSMPVTYFHDIVCSEESMILSREQINAIGSLMPISYSTRSWTLAYGLRRDGASIETLLSLCSSVDKFGNPAQVPTVIVIEDSWGYIFGGFVSSSLENRPSYYGNGESFVFSVAPVVEAFKWTSENYFFMLSNNHCLAMGGGNEGFAFQLDDELDTGVSNRSATYNNSQLSSSEFFKTLNVEVWTLGIDGINTC